MGSSTVVLIAVVVIVALAGLFVFTTSARRDRQAALKVAEQQRDDAERTTARRGRDVERAVVLERRGEGKGVALAPAGAPPVARAPMDPETLGVTRRQFFNRSITAFFTLGLSGFGAASVAFLWPSLSAGFGSKIKVGKLDEILGEIASNREPFYLAEGRTWITPYPPEAASRAEGVYTGPVLEGMTEGVVALYQKCVHLGCRVPFCKSSQWFECPCHGSRYNRVGEQKGGPAPRGLDRFGVEVTGGVLVVDTSEVIQGPPLGTNTTGQEAEGPHCA